MEDQKKQPFKRMVLSSIPILSELLPDGCHLPWWKKAWGKIKIWGFNVPFRNGKYDSTKLFKELFDPDLLAGDLKTPVAITAYIPTIDASVVSHNFPVDEIPKGVLKPEMMPHDNYRMDKVTPVWVLTSQSAAIPLNFFNVPLFVPLNFDAKNKLDLSSSFYNFSGCGDQKRPWQITGSGLLGIQGGNGFAVEDGAVTTNLGAAAATLDKNKIIISIYPVKKAKPIEFDDRTRWAQWKGFIGPLYQIVKAGLFLLVDSNADKQKILENYYMKIPNENGEDEFYLPTLITIDCKFTRDQLEKQNGRKYPDWKQFNQYDRQTTLDIFNASYDQAVKKIIEGDLKNNIDRLFSDEDLKRMGKEGVSICLSGGGAAAVDEVAYTAALLDMIHEFREEKIADIAPEDRPIINLLTGTSAGALTAAYFANLHDSYCNPK